MIEKIVGIALGIFFVSYFIATAIATIASIWIGKEKEKKSKW